MASVKVILMKKNASSSGIPLAVRIIKDRKTSYIYIGHSVEDESMWDEKKQRVKKSHPSSTRLNNLILKKLTEADNKLLDLEIANKDSSAKLIKKSLKSSSSDSNFSTQANIFIENLRKAGKYNRVSTEQPRIKTFNEFVGNREISFAEITVPLLNSFKAYLVGAKGLSERTVVNYLILIRTIFNQAIAGHLVDPKHYPFGKGKISIKLPQSQKIGLSIKEVQKIESVELMQDSYINHARNIWLLSFYFAGMRISDVLRLKWKDFQDGRLYYTMGKNLKVGSLKVPQKVNPILLQYRTHEQKHDLIFPELKVLENLENQYDIQRKISYATKRIDKALKKVALHEDVSITKKLTMHIARHTFGNISRDKIPVQVLQGLYRHTDIKTTMGYQANFIHKEADAALDAVVDF